MQEWKDAYFVIHLSVKSQKYVRFQWKDLLYKFFCYFGLFSALLVFKKLIENSYLSLEKPHCKNNHLPQRYALNSIFIRGLSDGKAYTDIYLSTLKLFVQYQEVLPRVKIRISRNNSRFCGNDIELSERESSKSTESMQGNPK